MSKKEDFKQFIATIPSIKEDVLNGRYSWQELYEIYLLYGKEDKFWNAYKNKTNGIDFALLLEMLKNVDVNQVTSSLASIEKLLGTLATFFPEESIKQTKQTKWYDE